MKSDVLINVPADVPLQKRNEFIENYTAVTRGTGRLFLFACDQKIEHLNEAFFGPGIAVEDNDPEHLFRIAAAGHVGLLATHLGLIARYGQHYPDIQYLVKLNAKTNLIHVLQKDPISAPLWSVADVVRFKESSGLHIRAIGCTIYLGSEYEAEMMQFAAQSIFEAHANGLLAVLWVYPRGKAVRDERSAQVIAGAAGVGACLGGDFVKINAPLANNFDEQLAALQCAVQAAGRTSVLVSGGDLKNEQQLISLFQSYIQQGGAAGAAIGRNIHQRDLNSAIELTKQLAQLIYDK